MTSADAEYQVLAVQPFVGIRQDRGENTQAMINLVSSVTEMAPRICLLINNGSALGDEVLPSLPAEARILVYDGPLATSPTSFADGRTADRLVGSLVDADNHPPLADVIAFARSNAEARAALATFARLIGASKSDPDSETILSRLIASMDATDLDLVILDDPLLAGCIIKPILGAKSFLVAGASKTFGGVAACKVLSDSSGYTQISIDEVVDTNWALFVRQTLRLPVHFFTVVRNGDLLLRYHQPVFGDLTFEWHWHIVDDLADVAKRQGLPGPGEEHDLERVPSGASGVDETRDYLSGLVARYPDRITIYRPETDRSWISRSQMLTVPLSAIDHESLLWQVDIGELWTAEQIAAVRDAFIAEPDRTAAWFWCRYYVGPDRGITTRYNYAQDPKHDGLRVWRFAPGMAWDEREPPALQASDGEGTYDVGRRFPFSHREMEARGAIFDHFAYATEAQVRFSQPDAGDDAVRQWLALQQAPRRSLHLGDYFGWVSDETMADTVERLGWTPLALFDPANHSWRFRGPTELAELRDSHRERAVPLIVVDGVFFQLSNTGIARLWINLLKEWCRSGFGDRVVLLDRGGTAPRIDGVRYHSIEPHNWATIDDDARYLQDVCDRLSATLFLSSYYTTPIRTPTVFMGYDMIPEALGIDRDDVWWSQKRRAIQHAEGWVMISRNSAKELVHHFPFLTHQNVLVAPCSVDPIFRPCSVEDIAGFRARHALAGDFVMLVGERLGSNGYKNGTIVFAALAMMPRDRRPLLVCVGGAEELEGAGKALLDEGDVRLLRLDDEELRQCYGASLAYICPSLMEGFGLPILEAMTVGTPALVCRNSSIPEVAGDAGVYFDPNDPLSLVEAIEAVRDPRLRDVVNAAGLKQAGRFDQTLTGRLIADHCLNIASSAGDRDPDRELLADAFENGEVRRDAVRTLQTVDRRVQMAKADIAVASHSVEAIQGEIDKPELSRRISAALDALTRADVTLQDVKRPVDLQGGNVPSSTSVEEGVTFTEATGLSRVEGPYPDAGMFKPFRWQIAATSTISFFVDHPMDAWLEVEFGNVQHDQRILLFLNEHPLCGFQPEFVGWHHVWRVRVPISLSLGLAKVAIEANEFDLIVADGRPLYVAVYGVRLFERAARVGDISAVEDVGVGALDGNVLSWTVPALEIPARLVGTVGLADREGPYPNWGIERAFRWQTQETSFHSFISEVNYPADLQVTFSNVEPAQKVVIWKDEDLLYSFTPLALGWEHQWRIIMPVDVRRGMTSVRIAAASHHDEGGGGRSLHIGLYDVRLLMRSENIEAAIRVFDLATLLPWA